MYLTHDILPYVIHIFTTPYFGGKQQYDMLLSWLKVQNNESISQIYVIHVIVILIINILLELCIKTDYTWKHQDKQSQRMLVMTYNICVVIYNIYICMLSTGKTRIKVSNKPNFTADSCVKTYYTRKYMQWLYIQFLLAMAPKNSHICYYNWTICVHFIPV